MGIVTREYVVNHLLSDDADVQLRMFHQVKQATGVLGRYIPQGSFSQSGNLNIPSIDVEAAHVMYDELKEFVLRRGSLFGKCFRPYLCTDVNDMGLDPAQPWWGFEFETGYSSEDAMREALGHCWDSYDNVTFDSEGEGEYYSEVTFAPANMSDFLDSTAPARRYMNYLSDNSSLTYNSGKAFVGTHINISVPSMRNTMDSTTIYSQLCDVRRALNYSVGYMGYPELKQIFGRAPLYGGFFLNTDDKGNYWFEGKVFRTTYEEKVFDGYVKASEGITKAIQYLVDNRDVPFISNMFDLLVDPTVTIVPGTKEEMSGRWSTLDPNGNPNYDYEEAEDDWEEGPEGPVDSQGREWCAECGVYH